jgi:hypothetical protein
MRPLIYVISGMILGAGLFACAKGLKVSIYYLDPAKGLVRSQDNQVIPFSQAKGYFCLSPSDTEALVTELKACQQAGG